MLAKVTSFFLLILFPVVSFGVHKLQLGADVWCPYTCDPKSDKPGYMVEIAKAILRPKQIDVIYLVIPWARAIEDANAGKIDGVIGANRIEAAEFVIASKGQGAAKFDIFALASSSWTYAGEKSLKGKKIGVIKGYGYDEESVRLMKAKPENFFEAGGEDPQEILIKNLISGRIQGFYENESVFSYALKMLKHSAKEFKKVGTFDSSQQEVFVALAKKTEKAGEIANWLGKGMADLRKSGELKKILDKYGVQDWE